MKKLTALLALSVLMMFSSVAFAHSPICNCFDNGDDTVTCEGGFSDGSSASGVKMVVMDGSGKVLLEGKMNQDSEFTFDKPGGDYKVSFDAGEGHSVVIDGSKIVE